jgi:hypothetical protein
MIEIAVFDDYHLVQGIQVIESFRAEDFPKTTLGATNSSANTSSKLLRDRYGRPGQRR